MESALRRAIDDTLAQLPEEKLAKVLEFAREMVEPPPSSRGARMAALLEEVASRGASVSIEDPVAWQRAEREDRPLPGRE